MSPTETIPPIGPFGWNENAAPDITPQNLELDRAQIAAYAEAHVASEATLRSEADTALSGRVTGAESAAATAVSGEASARANADTALAGSIATEATARAAADTTLTNSLATETANRKTAVTGAETAATTAAGNAETGAITAATSKANTAQSNAETAAATKANTAQTNAETAATAKVKTEEERAKAAEEERVKGTQASAGANGATYGRTSTIAAPVLRDVVSILDFAAEANGNGTTDDTAIFQVAVTAIEKTVTAGTLLVTPHNPKGELASWVVGHVTPCNNLTVSAYGANFKAKAGVNEALFGNHFTSAGEKGVIAYKNVRWFGGHFNGVGTETANQQCIAIWRGENIVVRDVKATKWGGTAGAGTTGQAGPIFFSDSRRVRVEGCILTECCKSGGQNAINFTSQGNTDTTTPYSEIVITNNIVTGGSAAPICVQLQLSNKYVNVVPTRVVISGNVCETTAFAAVALEIGGGAGGEYPESHLEQVIVSNNICTMKGETTGNACGIWVLNDSAPELLTAAMLYSDIRISSNIVESTNTGIILQGSRISAESNTVTAFRNGIFARGLGGTGEVPVTPSVHVHVKGGSIRMKGAAAGGTAAVSFNDVTDGSIDTDAFWVNGAEGEGKGVFLKNCSRIDVKAKVGGVPRQGVLVEGGGNIYIGAGAQVYNAGTQTATAGIETKKITGPVWVRGAVVRDDRGGESKTTYGVSNEAPEAGGLVFSIGNTYLGWTKALPWNGTITTQAGDTVDETGVVWTARKRETWGEAAPTTGTWAVGDKAWNTKPSAGGVAFWLCTTAGTPGTWTAYGEAGTTAPATNGVIIPIAQGGNPSPASTSIIGTAFKAWFGRAIVPSTGKILDVSVYTGSVVNGKTRVAVYDCGDAVAGKYTLLWQSEEIELTEVSKILSMGAPGLSVLPNQEIMVGLMNSGTTASFGRVLLASTNYAQLPASYLPVSGGALPKIAAQHTFAALSFETLTEAQMEVGGNSPGVIGRVA